LPQGITSAPATDVGLANDLGTAKDLASANWNAAEPPSAWEKGWTKFTEFADKHPIMTGSGLYLTGSKLGLFNPKQGPASAEYNGPLTKYKLADNFQGSHANPQDFRYTAHYDTGGITQIGGGPVEAMSNANAIGANTDYPQAGIAGHDYATPWQTPISRNVLTGDSDVRVDPYTGEEKLASGGVARYAKGSLTDTLDYYTNMMDGHNSRPAPAGNVSDRDVGIFRDADPDTMYLTAPEAAQVRMGKINSRANMQGPTLPRMGHLGTLNLKPQGGKPAAQSTDNDVEAAHGGIMQAHSTLGGYAAGGNPRLLKGPGDGMSDNIPATIAGKQPARLADGEFVVPADVVSHLGNGSTDAGAKKLHQMMTEVRRARTGNPKQGKEINPNKYMPK
jgi:hypothetical protein